MDVSPAIRARIGSAGPISFAEFMEMALYAPGGFYEDPPVGEWGHFTTSPHVHPVFGLLLAEGIANLWELLGCSGPPNIVEIGAGDGTLASQLLEELPGADYTAIERSEKARGQLSERGIHSLADISEAEDGLTAVLVANELLDNLPFHRVRSTRHGLVELRVGLAGEGFALAEAPCAPELAAAAPPLREGEEAAVSLSAFLLTDEIARVLGRGYALLIDYERAPGEPSGGVHGYRDHKLVIDSLERPGESDITAGVDFSALGVHAPEVGFAVHGPTLQHEALRALGFDRWAKAEREQQARLISDGSGVEAAKTWSGRNAAHLLVDRAALGGLGWLTLATPELPPPPWAG